MRSPICSISSMRCVMKMTPTPARESSPTSSNSRSRVATSSAEVASSRIRIFGFRTSARTMPHACRSESESSSTAIPRSTSRPSSLPSISLARAAFSRGETLVVQIPSAPSQTLSSTEQDSATRTSWKTVKTPRLCASRGVLIDVTQLALELDLAGVRHVDAAQDLDHRRLAAAVLADERVDLAGAQLERGVADGLGRSERLGDVGDAQERGPPIVAGRLPRSSRRPAARCPRRSPSRRPAVTRRSALPCTRV